jgi:hypothetical protein
MRPGEVPDEFAHAVVFEVERHRAHQLTILPGDENARLPARAWPHAARALQRGQEGMFEEGIVVVDQRIPGRADTSVTPEGPKARAAERRWKTLPRKSLRA